MKFFGLPFFTAFILILGATNPALLNATESSPEIPASLANIQEDQIDSVLAKLSDGQVRALLLTELAKNSNESSGNQLETPGGLVKKTAKWLHILDSPGGKTDNATSFFDRLGHLPGDYLAVAKHVGNGSFAHFIFILAQITAVFAFAWLMESLVRRFTLNFRKQFREKAIPTLDGPMRLVAGIMLAVPSFIHISVFTVSATLLFTIVAPDSSSPPARYVFLAILFGITIVRLLSQVSQLFFSPGSPSLRVLSMDDNSARTVHRTTVFLVGYIFTTILFLALRRELLLEQSSLLTTAITTATILIILLIFLVLQSHNFVKNALLKKSEQNKTRNWVIEQFSQFWHVPTILFFLIIWIALTMDLLSGTQRENSAFLKSLLVVPLFLIFNGIGQWVVKVSIKTLRIYTPHDSETGDEETKKLLNEARERERKFYVTTSRIMTLAIITTLSVWVMNLWGIELPYATTLASAVFESLVAMSLGLIVWRFASSYIEKKISEAAPEEDTKEENDEWGGAASKGRSYTLLPMLRKFIASTLLLMVSLVILSAIGIDIGPLLAGAGVVGLAVGFGAQKMVSDVFSGFFYLLDDAFRVGEYIKAANVSGAVESITLRNVMLRHHRGMLQIVPHSELGSITNFMRGGIIEKFNLEFSYDADVDKIRKVIKKVGLAMLEDEELKDDFIQPVKSAGVREITGSVMVIRVKFKVQPGAQFVIRREAYRRITEALAAKGIHYAHRKVIVELPEQAKNASPEEKENLLEAGAAAALIQQEEDEKKKLAANQKSSGS